MLDVLAVVAIGIAILLMVAVVGLLLFTWITRPTVYATEIPEDLQFMLRAFGPALADRETLILRARGVKGDIQFRKRTYKTRPDTLTLRFRNADETKQHFEAVREALIGADMEFEMERTPKLQRPRAIAMSFAVVNPIMPSALYAAVQAAIVAMKAPRPVRFEMHTYAQPSPEVRAAVTKCAGWSGPYRAGFALARAVRRLFGHG